MKILSSFAFLIVLASFLFLGAKLSPVFAQNCSGSYSGSDGGRYKCIYNAATDVHSCQAYSFNYSDACSSGNPGGCSAAKYDMEQTCSAPGGNSCTVQTQYYEQTFTTSGCSNTPSCPSGQIYCGGCIGGCRSNSKTCNEWIAQDCGGSGGGGGWQGCGSCGSCPGGNPSQCVLDPSGNCLWDPGGCGGGAPPCLPSCSSPYCGQSNGCGGSCSSSDLGAAGTPTISLPTDGGIAVSNASGQITIDWNNTALADAYRLELYTSANPDVDWTTTAGALSTATGTGSTTRTRAFDISTSTYWQSTEAGAAVSGVAWIGQNFSKPRTIRKILLKQHPANANYRITSANVQFSDDGTSWTTLQTIALPNDGNTNTFDIDEGDAHQYWRLLANSGTGNGLRWLVYDLEMRVAGDPVTATVISRNASDYTFTPTSRDYTIRVRALNTTCVASGQTSQWSPWITFIATSPVSGQVYYDGNNTAVLSGSNACTGSGASLPATSPDVTATAFAISNANYSASYPPARSFDNNNTTYWASRQLGLAVNGVSWIGQNFGTGNGKEIRKLSLRQYPNSLNRVSAVYVEHSDDGASWTTLQTLALASNGNTNSYFLNASSAHQYWRLRAASGVGSGRVWAVQEIEMFEISAVDLGTLTVTGRDYQQYADQVTVTPEGNYAINLPYSNTGTNQVSLIIDRASDFICSCPIGCTFSGVNAPLANLDFYITDAREPWFQTVGGSIATFGSEGTVLTNPVPDTCENSPTCHPYLLTQRDGQASSSGFVLTGGGDVDLDRDTGLQTSALDEDGTRRVGKVNLRVAQETYEYFYRLYKFSANPASDFGDTAADAQQPSVVPVNVGTNAYYHGGDLTILDPWSLAADGSVVVFVEGDLHVRNTVRVEIGSFLAFVVKGDIVFDADLGHTDPTAPTADESIVEGIYIANGILSFPSRGAAAGGDYKFVGEGTFVGWSGVELDRNYDDNLTRRTLNNTNPVEVFRYRPDFAVRAPAEMKTPRILWREVAP